MIWLDQFGQDLRYGLRGLLARRTLTTVTLLCLGGGIAAATTVFSVFNAIVLRPFPFSSPDQLVTIVGREPRTGQRAAPSYAEYRDLRAAVSAFSDVGAYTERLVAVTEGEEPERVGAVLVSSSLFPTLGVRPQLGRLFTTDEDSPGAERVALISDALWHRRYGGDSTVVGRTISLDGLPTSVVGVMEPGFAFPETSELWLPIAPVLGGMDSGGGAVAVIGRLATGIGLGAANSELATVSPAVRRRDEPNSGPWVAYGAPLRRSFIGPDDRIITTAMMGAVTFLLLLACANVANLLLTQASRRRREIAVRAAIGAGRGRLARQLLTEAFMLAAASGVLALPLTWEGLRLIQAAIPASDPFPYYVHWSLDASTLAYELGVVLLVSVLVGGLPALSVTRGRLYGPLVHGGGDTAAGAKGRRSRNALVAVEVALSLLLLTGGSLFVRQFLTLGHVDLGYDVRPLSTLRFYLPGSAYDGPAARQRFIERVLSQVESTPDVLRATISDLIPLDDEGGSYGGVAVEGSDVQQRTPPRLFYAGVAGDWFETFDVGLLGGRDFNPPELRDGAPVAVINQTMATTFWGDEESLGKRFRLTDDPSNTWLTVIGVAPDIRTVKLDENRTTPPTAYVPHRFVTTRDYALIVRTRDQASSVGAALREAFREADSSVPVFNVRSMAEVRRLSFWMYQMWSTIFGVFGAVSLLLAAVGVYGVMFYSVARRTVEVGIRMALGAERVRVLSVLVREGMIMVGLGIVLGLVGSLALTRVVSGLLIGITATDIGTFGLAASLLAFVAGTASFVPAWRASRLDPTVALRAG